MSRQFNRAEAEAFLRVLLGLMKAQTLYPSGHAAVRRAREQMDALLAASVSGRESLLIGVADGYLVVGGIAFLENALQAQELAKRLETRGAEGVVLEARVRAEEVGRFCEWLRANGAEAWQSGDICLTPLSRERSAWSKALRLHRTALEAVREACQDVEEGRIPDAAKARESVLSFSDMVGENPSILQGLVLLKDYDRYTFQHSVNVCLLALGVGRQLSLSVDELECLGIGGLFHDIGKTRTPLGVIRKPGRLSENEWSLIHEHPVHGRDILSQMEAVSSAVPQLVYEHHMGHDGGGYPCRAPGRGLHTSTPLITIADVYDAMTSHRPYNPPIPLPVAIRNLLGMQGKHLAPAVVDAFVRMMGTVPVGSLVRLGTGEVGVVARLGPRGEVDQVRVIAEPDGRDLGEGERPLRSVSAADIAGWTAPLSRNVDVFEVLRSRS